MEYFISIWFGVFLMSVFWIWFIKGIFLLFLGVDYWDWCCMCLLWVLLLLLVICRIFWFMCVWYSVIVKVFVVFFWGFWERVSSVWIMCWIWDLLVLFLLIIVCLIWCVEYLWIVRLLLVVLIMVVFWVWLSLSVEFGFLVMNICLIVNFFGWYLLINVVRLWKMVCSCWVIGFLFIWM